MNRLTIARSMALPIVCCFGASCAGSVESDSASVEASLLKEPPSIGRGLAPKTRFFTPVPKAAAVEQVADLVKHKAFHDALSLAAMEATPTAVWFTSGSSQEVEAAVRSTMVAATREHAVPILVAYNVPFRDCAQYSAGGAVDTAEYEAWIDGFARGIGKGKAVVIVEPDALGIIPYNTTIYGATDWCQPTVTDVSGSAVPAPGANPTERYQQINYAVDSLESQAPNAAVYLDGTHSAFLGVGEAAYRLVQAGVLRAQGFFLNISNYQLSTELVTYGTWVSDCIAAAENGASWALGHFDYCPSQYNPTTGYGLDYSEAYAATVNASLAGMLNGAVATTHFVLDTSRNGQGVLDPSKYVAPPYNQPATVIGALNAGNWCNARSAGAGARPTADAGTPLVDAYLWVKVPGESDGSCDIAGGARGWDYSQYDPWSVSGDAENHFDPLWGQVDPAAGQWFPEQATELANQANPPFCGH